MRIAVYHNLPSGGGKRALFEMTRRLTALHDVDVYTLSTAEHMFCDLRPFCGNHIVFPFQPGPLAGRPFGRLNQLMRSIDLYRLQKLNRSIAQLVDSRNYDIVFANVCRFGQSPSILKYLETPSAYYCQEPPRILYEPSEPRAYRQYPAIQRLGNRFDPFPNVFRRTLREYDKENVIACGAMLVNSHYSRESMYRVYGIFATFSRLGVDTTIFRPVGSETENMVISVGALTSKKGFDFLIQSIAQIEVSRRPKLVISSNYVDLMEKEFLQALADQLQVSVVFLENTPDEALVELYSQAKLCVYAPIMEPFGFVPLEAMACGTPVIAVREGGVRETVQHQKTGLLTERDPVAFAEAMTTLLEDSAKRASFGSEARRYVETSWTWEMSTEDLEKQFRRVIGH